MLIDYAAITHVGRVRKNNEDAFLVSALDGDEPHINLIKRQTKVCQVGLLAAVADGMGGAAAGEIASRESLAAMAVNLFGHWGRFPRAEATEAGLLKALKHAVEESSHAVIRWSDTERSARGMGSTLTAAVIWNGHAYIAQVGDSRAYLFRRPQLVQLTEDQTLVNEMIAKGHITPEEARNHPQRSMITQALGCPIPIQTVLSKIPLRRGDRLLLCSDGLHGEVKDDLLRDILDRGFSLRRSLEMMLETTLEHGARDNVTALLLALDDPGFPLPVAGEQIRVTTPMLPPNNVRDGGLLSRLGRKIVGKP